MRSIVRAVASLTLLAALPGTPPAAAATAAPATDPITANDPDFMATFSNQYHTTFGDGAVPAKYKDLAGAVLSVAVKCEECLTFHIKAAIKHGATRAEIVEMLRVALVAGGSAGLPTMGAAYAAMDEAKLK